MTYFLIYKFRCVRYTAENRIFAEILVTNIIFLTVFAVRRMVQNRIPVKNYGILLDHNPLSYFAWHSPVTGFRHL